MVYEKRMLRKLEVSSMGLGCMRLRAKATALGVCIGCLLLMSRAVTAQQDHLKLVRIAEIEVDPARLDAYEAELRQEIEASIRLEPGVLALYAVAVKEKPSQIRLFEVYSGEKAYRAHHKSAHFLLYKKATASMVKSLTLVETEPVKLGSR